MFEPENELGVIVLFAQQCVEAGFEILSIQTAFPDALVRRDGVEYHAEFEYQSSNFYQHGHDPRKADLVICWQRDGDCVLPILALSEQDWQQKEVVLPSQDKREIDYWKHRAKKAERKLSTLENQEAAKNEEARQNIYKHCSLCNFTASSPQAWAGHCKGAQHKRRVAEAAPVLTEL